MAADGNHVKLLYLTSCDTHARSASGIPMVAGGRFQCAEGYPSLPWGCGPALHVNLHHPRWLVLSGAETQPMPGGVRVFSAVVEFDGPLSEAARYLHAHGAASLPYVGRRRRGDDHAILTVGNLGSIEAAGSLIGAVGTESRLTAGAGCTVAIGPHAQAQVAEFSRAAGADTSAISTARFSTVAAGVESRVEVGEGSIVAVASGSHVRAGAASRVIVESGGSIDLGPRAVGVGSPSTVFRGADGALFVVTNATEGDESSVFQRRAGTAGVTAGRWYRYLDGDFVERDA